MANEVINGLSSYLFWDRDINKLDFINDMELILERVFSRGMENDEKQVFAMYDIGVIKEAVLKIKNLDKKTLNYLSIIFRIPKESFRCYKNMQFQSNY